MADVSTTRKQRAAGVGVGAGAGSSSSFSSASSTKLSSEYTKPFVYVTVGTTSFDSFVNAVCSQEFASTLYQTYGYSNVVLQIGRGKFSPPVNCDILSHTKNSETDETWLLKLSLPFTSTSSSSSSSASSSSSSTPRRANSASKRAKKKQIVQKEQHDDDDDATTHDAVNGKHSSVPFPPSIYYHAYRFKPQISADIQASAIVISHAGAGSIFETLRGKKPLVVVINTALADNHQIEIAEAMGGSEGGEGEGEGGGVDDGDDETCNTKKTKTKTDGSGVDTNTQKKQKKQYLVWCEPKTLVQTMAREHETITSTLTPLPPKNASGFVKALESLMR